MTNYRIDFRDNMLRAMSRLIKVISLLSFLVTLFAVVLEAFSPRPQLILLVGDALFCLSCLFLFLFAKRIKSYLTIFVLIAYSLLLTSVGIYFNGMTMTNLTTLYIVIILLTVFIWTRLAAFISFLIPTLIMTAAFVYFFFADSLPEDFFSRKNQPRDWLLASVVAYAFTIVTMSSIKYMKNRLFETIASLKEKNESLVKANRELGQSREEVERLAYKDQPSGMFNRAALEKHVSARIAQGVDEAHLILFDVKNFRAVNFLFGTKRGDELINSIAAAFLPKKGYFFARLGGGEFALWREEPCPDPPEQTIKALKSKVNEHESGKHSSVSIEFFTSLCQYPRHGLNFDECLANAEIALKYAKDSNNVQPVRFTDTIKGSMSFATQLEVALREGLRNNEFTVAYQDQVNIRTGQVYGVEALARWESAKLGPISPSVFIPAVTRLGLMETFGKIIAEQVLSDVPRLKELKGEQIKVSINVSPSVFLLPSFEKFTIGKIRETGYNNGTIVLEITEDVFAEDIIEIQRIVSHLKEEGIEVSLDDFGTGFSSLSYLRSISFNELKVDKAFIDDLATDRKTFELFRSICSIARTYNIRVIAEGIESQEQIQKLLDTPCDVVQGYFYSRPKPLISKK